MKKYNFLAFDLGATSGRAVLGTLCDGKIETKELYRFPNAIVELNGKFYWNLLGLYEHLKAGLVECVKSGVTPDSIGVDTWGVDVVPLGKDGSILGMPRAYRDPYTDGAQEQYFEIVPREEVYDKTGIQFMNFNTLFQIFAAVKEGYTPVTQAETLLFMPDALSYMLTGKKICEYTIASTSQILNPRTAKLEESLLASAGVSADIFPEVQLPGSVIGQLTDSLAEESGIGKVDVVAVAGHDTASAVAACPITDSAVYISSGTWSLLGIERLVPDTSELSMEHNFTNEGGFNMRYRYLKNITGLWMIQSMKKELGGDYTFDMLCNMAKEYDTTPLRVDPNDDRFTAPDSMIEEVKAATGKADLSIGEMFSVVYHSLADTYKKCIAEVEEIAGKEMKAIHIVGGGCKDDYLCALTAKACGKPVYAGPVEATAIGNLASQMISTGVFGSLSEARTVIFNSFDVKSL